jgi:demethylspheroidene O-methyltransferase
MFGLVAGFVHSQTLWVCLKTGLLDQVRHGELSLDQLAKTCALPAPTLAPWLESACGLQLLERTPTDAFMLGPQGAALLAQPGVQAMIEHHSALYADLANPLDLRAGAAGHSELSAYWGYARGGGDPESTNARKYSALMAQSQDLLADQIIQAFDFGRYKSWLDVGGGHGALAMAVHQQHPQLAIRILDLPAVVATAPRCSAVQWQALDVFATPWPGGADLISLVRVVHDHDQPAVEILLQQAFAALPPGGTLLLAEPMLRRHGADPVGAYFQIYLLAMGQGRLRTKAELRQLLEAAGFVAVRRLRTSIPDLVQVLVARKP